LAFTITAPHPPNTNTKVAINSAPTWEPGQTAHSAHRVSGRVFKVRELEHFFPELFRISFDGEIRNGRREVHH
jgi:hypothetical protein